MNEKITAHLAPGHPWRDQIQYFDIIDSTNTRCKQLALSGAAHGTVLLAGGQTAGRGRLGRNFSSPDGMGVYMSILLRPDCAATELMHLTCAAAVAACNAIEQVCGLRPGIKWTNDLVLDGKKIAGILTELVHGPQGMGAVIGIGVNCCQQAEDFPPELQSMAGSLQMAAGKPVDRFAVAAALLEAFEIMDRSLLAHRDAMLAQYRIDCITLGKDVCLTCADAVRYAHAVSIDRDGALIVRFPDGHTESIATGEVSVRGMYGYI